MFSDYKLKHQNDLIEPQMMRTRQEWMVTPGHPKSHLISCLLFVSSIRKTTTMDTAPPDTINAIQEHLDFLSIRRLMSTCRSYFTALEPFYWSRIKLTVCSDQPDIVSWLFNKKVLVEHVRELYIVEVSGVSDTVDVAPGFHECLSWFINVDKIHLNVNEWKNAHKIFEALKCKPREFSIHINNSPEMIDQTRALREFLHRGVRSINVSCPQPIDFLTEDDLQRFESICTPYTDRSLFTYRLPNLRKIELSEHLDLFNSFAALNPQITHVTNHNLWGIPPFGDLLPNLQHLVGAVDYGALMPMSDGRFRPMETFSLSRDATPPPASIWAAHSRLKSLSIHNGLPDYSHLPSSLTDLSIHRWSYVEVDKVLSQVANLRYLACVGSMGTETTSVPLPRPGTRLEQFQEVKNIPLLRWLNHPNCPSTIEIPIRCLSVQFTRDGFYCNTPWFVKRTNKLRWMICSLQGDRWVEAKEGSIWIFNEEQWERASLYLFLNDKRTDENPDYHAL
ncbi:hypothetical protein PROFUN_08654 [Planoprotostelium fungivorum]|uniref:Uncharacterized protein n=1 Tax=Planoprotostelium fungivorum TaxID=1890364 RepID=A0A2P6NJ38_9EUKA|nr:hypothetical protein PROFUN_08654 [Planoprotostelium fungivorum]